MERRTGQKKGNEKWNTQGWQTKKKWNTKWRRSRNDWTKKIKWQLWERLRVREWEKQGGKAPGLDASHFNLSVMKLMDDTHRTANCNNYSAEKLWHTRTRTLTLYGSIERHMRQRPSPFMWPISSANNAYPLVHPLRLYSDAFLWCAINIT